MMDVEGRIRSKLIEVLSPTRLKIDNDSKRHAGPATDTHFRLVVVSEAFEGHHRVARQRMVFACLAEELDGPVHALQMKCLTEQEYAAAEGEVTLKAPPCAGAHREP